jgi:hypothetical protein
MVAIESSVSKRGAVGSLVGEQERLRVRAATADFE